MKQEKTKNYADNFNKKQGTFLYDDKRDEMMLNVLELYPNKTSFFFQGQKGKEKREELQKKVRSVFDKSVTEIEDFENAGGRGKKKLKDAFKKIGKTIATASLAPARGAALALIRLNFRNSAKKFNILNSRGKDSLEARWEKLGGNKSKLNEAIKAGRDKKPFVCGKKCRAQGGKNPQLPTEATTDFVNFEPATTTAIVAAGGTVVGGLLKIVGDKKNVTNQKELMLLNAELNQKQKEEDTIDATMTPQEKKIADEIIKAQQSGFDPIEAIKNNPNLTAEEKEAAIAEIEETQGSSDKSKTIKMVVGGAALLLAGFLIYKLTENKSE